MKRILVAIDGTDMSRTVLARALELGRALGGKLRLLRVVPITPPLAPPGAFALPASADPTTDAAVVAAREALLALELEVPDPFRDGVEVELGTAAETICRYATTYDAHVVVIGAHRHNVIARLLGTTAARVANKIDRPVLVVRPEPPKKAETAKAEAAPPVELPAGARASEHTMLEATTLTGATVGAVLGAIGGPPGAIAGGAIGTAFGMIAGVALDEQDKRTSFHDHELDDAIGVTRGDLGARERAAAGLTEMLKGMAASNGGSIGVTAASATLRAEHERLEQMYAALAAAYTTDDWGEVRVQYGRLEAALIAHMELEEKSIFPAFRAVDDDEAKALLAEHDELRRRLAALGIAIDLHAVPRADVDALLARLRAHATREAYLLYPWMDESLGTGRVAPAA
jgi:nucleotide-binding universal stress UspA family protein